ncbi:MAG: hypothetical protein GTO55_09890 [Armatimonadetes bacterium]|nr:hypothetical protein [Armatimonadota bacterium]NIM24554.1 hypothetical protein [Armatimonadota bacterium]NIM68428.1 hypothetical protein [Armatimonadota bacterium]NIM76814.1 hypothetical protein [Armatimonadota bacterium]NIN06627.1 hypothetical protein [Armatimonadota bacterium]
MIRAWACLWQRARYGERIWLAIALVSLLSVTAVSDCRAAERETVKTPPLTQTASGPVLIGAVRGREIRLAGVWEPETGWRSAANADEDKELMPNGTVWTLYGLNQPPLRVKSGPPSVKPRYEPRLMRNRPEDFYVSAELPSRPRNRCRVAVSGIDLMNEPPVRILHNWISLRELVGFSGTDLKIEMRKVLSSAVFAREEDPATTRLCKHLLDNSPFKEIRQVNQVVYADLDGDSEEEHLITFEGGVRFYYAPRDKASPAKNSMIAVAHMTDSDTHRVSILTEMAQSMLRGPFFHSAGVRYAEILAITDINGDGRREVAINTDGADWWAFEVYAFDGNRFHQVLFFGGYWAEIREGEELRPWVW